MPARMKHNKKHSAKHSAKHSKSYSKSAMTVYLDMTDKSLLDFKKAKSISVASKISDLKSSKVGELYDVKPIHDNMHRLCLLKLQAKSAKDVPIPKKISKNICECLFEKNKELTVAELEKRVNARLDTPASQCITILDNHLEKNATRESKSNKSYSSRTTKTTSKTTSKTNRKSSRKTKN